MTLELGVRGKLFAVSLLLITVVGLGSGLYLQQVLRGWLEARIEAELLRDAQIARALLEVADPEFTVNAMDPLAKRLADSSGASISVMSGRGEVLGNSLVKRWSVGNSENQSAYSEVKRALAHENGVSRRYSTTVGAEMLNVAVPFDTSRGAGVVRVAMPLSEVDEAVARLRLLLGVAGLVGLGLSIFMSGLASQLATRAMRGLVDSARQIASGEGIRRLHVPSTDELGRLAGTFNEVVGELDQTVRVLADERDHLETILDSMSEGVLALDTSHHITRVNRAALELLAVKEPVSGAPLLETIRVPELIELVTSESAPRGQTAEFALPGARFVQAHSAPLRTGGCVVVMRDVTRTRQLEATRRDFVANVSHELRTPVSVIRANAETLSDGAINDPESAPVFLAALSRNADRLAHILSDLLGLASMEAGEYELKKETVDVQAIGARVISSLTSAADAKELTLKNELAAGTMAWADAHAVEQVLTNLLENAVRYSDKGGAVSLRGLERAGGFRIEVVDDGPGVSAPHRERVFERFYRVDPGRSREMGGTGLGLSIVKHLVEAMKGRVGVDPREPRGSVFWFTLPRA